MKQECEVIEEKKGREEERIAWSRERKLNRKKELVEKRW